MSAWVLAYVAVGLVAGAITGRRMRRYCLHEYPLTYDGKFRSDGMDWFLVVYIAAVWPVGLPVLYLMTRIPVEKGPREVNTAERIFFGETR